MSQYKPPIITILIFLLTFAPALSANENKGLSLEIQKAKLSLDNAVKSINITMDDIGRSLDKTKLNIKKSLDETMIDLGDFLDETGEVAGQVAEGAVVLGVLMLYVMAESNCYYYGNCYNHRYCR